MSDKYAGFGTTLEAGVQQVETATVVGTIVNTGNAHVIVTATGMSGSPLTTHVAVVAADTADTVATKMRTALRLVGVITALFAVGGSGPYITLTALLADDNDTDLNIATENDTCSGLTTEATSVQTIPGVAPVDIAAVKNISGPGLSVDTEDVTTHDSPAAFEEVVTTIIRSGTVSLDIEYDPAEATHSASAGGVIYRLENLQYTWFRVTFPSSETWSFSGYVTGFNPSGPAAGALTATVTIKITGQPTLE
jgi:hypothetical protein